MNHIENAIDEQLRSFICPDAREHELKNEDLSFLQTTGFRRSAQTIIIDAIDKNLKQDNFLRRLNAQRKKRRRRRGPRVLVINHAR